jgi:hypothetical protein
VVHCVVDNCGQWIDPGQLTGEPNSATVNNGSN